MYSVGVREIDNQHHRFFDLIDELFHARSFPMHNATILPYILKELTAYAEYHFAAEEKYFELYHYEFAAEHKMQHRDFKDKVRDLTKRHEGGEKDTVLALAEFMEDWLVNHIADSDRKYTECFQKNGLI